MREPVGKEFGYAHADMYKPKGFRSNQGIKMKADTLIRT